jgi:nitrite reductase/ring-hydroxylating ferredoxin subunit
MEDWRSLPHAPPVGTRLCDVGEVPDGGAREVQFGEGKNAFGVLLIRRGEQVWAYRNCCPHYSIPLNYEPQLFHTVDGEILMCAHHTAMFRVDDGYCYDGPCLGAHLQALPLQRDGALLKIG